MHPGVRSFGKTVLVTYTIPTAPLVTIVSKSCLIVQWSMWQILIGLISFMVIAIRHAAYGHDENLHLPLTNPASPFSTGGTIVGTMPWLGQ